MDRDLVLRGHITEISCHDLVDRLLPHAGKGERDVLRHIHIPPVAIRIGAMQPRRSEHRPSLARRLRRDAGELVAVFR